MKKAHAGRADLWGGSPFSSRTSARAQEGSKKGKEALGEKKLFYRSNSKGLPNILGASKHMADCTSPKEIFETPQVAMMNLRVTVSF